MQQADYNAYYQYPHHQSPNPNPNPISIPSSNPNPPNLIDHQQNSYASAPPFNTSNYASSDCPPYLPQNPYSLPTAPSYTPSPATPSPSMNPNNLQSTFNPPSQPPPPQQQQQPPFAPYDSHGPYQPPTSQPSYYSAYDQHQTPPNYSSPPNPVYTAAPYNSVGPSVPHGYDNNYSNNSSLYDNSPKFDHGVGYFDDKYGGYSRGVSDFGSDLYGKRQQESRYDDSYGDGVYAYEGSKLEPYGAKGTAPKSSTWAMFDDYGRAINIPSDRDSASFGSGSSKIVRAVPKAETQQDVKSGVQKFRVKLLAESGGQSNMDVLCQIGLDGIRMLDPNTGRTLRIYSLENITRCDKTDSSTFAFWSKSSVDVEPRRIRLQSNSYTTSTLLDTVTAATVQLKEMGASKRPTESFKTAELATEKKKGFDWMNLVKPGNEEKDHWVPDEAVSKCTACGTDFGAFVRKHHCRNCGDIFCDKCTHGRIALTADENAQPVRVCDRCMAEVTQRLSNAREAAAKPASLQSHEDLARKLQEEMEKNRRASSGSKSDGSGRRMKEVACPTCTVHLQVQVPASGSETIECGVCQHRFLVTAH